MSDERLDPVEWRAGMRAFAWFLFPFVLVALALGVWIARTSKPEPVPVLVQFPRDPPRERCVIVLMPEVNRPLRVCEAPDVIILP